MRGTVVRMGMAAALLLGGSMPVAAAFGSIYDFGGTWCTQNSLQVCMNFDLQQDGSNPSNYLLVATWTSSQGGGAWTAFGLYHADPGQPGPNPTVSNVFFSDAAGNQVAAPTGWTAGGNDNPAISGDGSIFFVAGADTDQGVNGAIRVWPTTLRIAFTSTDLAGYLGGGVYARAHIQDFGDSGCSIKPDSRDTGDHLVGTAAEADAACGTTYTPPGGGGSGDSTVPEPISMVLLGSGLLGIGGARLRRRRQASLED